MVTCGEHSRRGTAQSFSYESSTACTHSHTLFSAITAKGSSHSDPFSRVGSKLQLSFCLDCGLHERWRPALSSSLKVSYHLRDEELPCWTLTEELTSAFRHSTTSSGKTWSAAKFTAKWNWPTTDFLISGWHVYVLNVFPSWKPESSL